MKIKVIGIGGIAQWLLPALCLFLSYLITGKKVEIVLIDGDEYQDRNKDRQVFQRFGNKAEVKTEELKKQYPLILFQAVSEYIIKENVYRYIQEDDIVFLCPDNPQCRRLVSDRCEDLENVCVISGGNDLTRGCIQIFIRQDGKDFTLPIANKYHPEYQNLVEWNPQTRGCEEQVEDVPQLVPTNNTAATVMLNAFYTYLHGEIDHDEVWFDILTGNSRACKLPRD